MDRLKELGLTYRESDNPERMNIDFTIEDGEDNVAWVWGDSSDDIDYECSHPSVEYEDDEHVGVCELCGATCDWHYEDDCGNVGSYYWNGKEKVPHDWHYGKGVGGIIKQIIEED